MNSVNFRSLPLVAGLLAMIFTSLTCIEEAHAARPAHLCFREFSYTDIIDNQSMDCHITYPCSTESVLWSIKNTGLYNASRDSYWNSVIVITRILNTLGYNSVCFPTQTNLDSPA